MGNVVIEDNVEIGANSTIDRATLGNTLICKVKIDNLVQIAHNVEIGTNTVIASQTGVAGSTKLESSAFCWSGGHSRTFTHSRWNDSGCSKPEYQIRLKHLIRHIRATRSAGKSIFRRSSCCLQNLSDLQK